MTTRGKTEGGRKCEGCGARVRREARFCEYCGAELPRPPAPKPAAPSRHGDLAARFAALKSHRAYADLLRRRPSSFGAYSPMLTGLAFGLFFAAVAWFFFVRDSAFDRRTFGALALIPVLFVVIGLGIAGWSLSRVLALSRAPLKRLPALVAGERTDVTGGGGNSSARTSYRVTLEYENGFRREYRTDGEVVGLVSQGDVGVAYVKGNWLLAFAVVRV